MNFLFDIFFIKCTDANDSNVGVLLLIKNGKYLEINSKFTNAGIKVRIYILKHSAEIYMYIYKFPLHINQTQILYLDYITLH